MLESDNFVSAKHFVQVLCRSRPSLTPKDFLDVILGDHTVVTSVKVVEGKLEVLKGQGFFSIYGGGQEGAVVDFTLV